MRRRNLAMAVAGLAAGLPDRGRAQEAGWKPDRPLRVIVTFPPGGVMDICGRLGAELLGRALDQPVVVENRAGAGGNVGALAAAQAAPDGYTILLGSPAILGVNPVLYPRSGVDAARDFVPLGTIGEVANILSVVPRRVQATSVTELIAEAKRRPLLFGSVGNGSSSHLAGATFLKMAGIEATHVPYRGSAPLVTAMLAGEVDFGFDTTATSTPHIRSGAFRALAASTTRRASALPEVPTFAEAGLPGYDVGLWTGLFVHKATPAPVVAALRQAMAKGRTPEYEEKLRRAYVDPLVVPEADLARWTAESAARWNAVSRELKLEAD
ncbi:Tripartite-type tricarboxylate transporter, receptor component TctC [Roseomonas rosea]|uniref:Tripartite-type tricarboxylate transporter, receptor component TctC n=1 Tax=Muricoccus roseus TaxID=198092 RepID=A0A1M6SED5_9PROT|nr:tripartite tricarboxylate transporter substrate binding protein [Roseomonas rosea]SHK43144.1 Tripartite-type tricarboxylate transporter, receptor component TctC [Roseomonas rosea]